MIFKKVKEIKSKEGVLHFRRWRILWTPWFTINFHGIYHHDEDEHLHSHPWNFISMVLKGSYTERLESGAKLRYPGNVEKRTKDVFHKILTLHSKAVYTLNVMWGAEEGSWGYKVDGKYIDHKTYRELKRINKVAS